MLDKFVAMLVCHIWGYWPRSVYSVYVFLSFVYLLFVYLCVVVLLWASVLLCLVAICGQAGPSSLELGGSLR